MKLIKTTLMLAALGAFSIGAVACNKKDDKKETPEPAQKVTEEPKADDTAPQPAAEQPKVEETPAAEEPKAEEPAAGEAPADEAKAEEPAEGETPAE